MTPLRAGEGSDPSLLRRGWSPAVNVGAAQSSPSPTMELRAGRSGVTVWERLGAARPLLLRRPLPLPLLLLLVAAAPLAESRLQMPATVHRRGRPSLPLLPLLPLSFISFSSSSSSSSGTKSPKLGLWSTSAHHRVSSVH